MIVKSKGIVLSYMKYGDTSIIARVFTEERGYGSFIVNSVRSQRSKKSIGFFQPFSILDMVLYIKESRDLQRMSEYKYHRPLHQIHTDFTKSAVTLFLSEVITKLVQYEQSPNPSLYDFLEESIVTFDGLKEGIGNFHLQFLLKLGPYLGYEIEQADSLFSSIDKLVPDSSDHHVVDELMKDDYGTTYAWNRNDRNIILDTILSFYYHHAHISKPKSLDVLRSVLN